MTAQGERSGQGGITWAGTALRAADLAGAVAERARRGARFAGLLATGHEDGSLALRAVLAWPHGAEIVESVLGEDDLAYPALTPEVPGAAWYEREVRDLFGVTPLGHPRLDPLVLPLGGEQPRPRPGTAPWPERVEVSEAPLPGHVSGDGVFTIPYGPVRSGVFETVQYLVETPGEEILHLRTRVYHKHRGLAQRFTGLSIDDGVLLAERVEGTTSVAQATAFSQAIEALTATEAPVRAALVRVLHAELERVANHLDSMIRHTEGSGQAVAYARLSLHKERVLRLQARLCGHRFGRGVVVPGGVAGPPQLGPAEALAALARIERGAASDIDLLMDTPSFLDRLRGTGIVPPEVAAAHGALGPLGRGSGLAEDVRDSRPYGAYARLAVEPAEPHAEGDALARQQVRRVEVRQAFHLARQALDELAESGDGPWRVPVEVPDGTGLGWAEAPQGELLYLVETKGARLAAVKPRCASFHNLALFSQAFRGDIFTDFVFIEASFGLSIAGVSG
ncbi:MAG: NADH-quinone oxidoreductase subunit C [Acidimicrobiales bacterium]